MCFLNRVFRFWLNYYQSSTKNNLLESDNGYVSKTFFCDCVVCVCLTFCTIIFVIAFFMAFGFLMGVLTISFGLPIDLYKALWIPRNGLLTKILF